MVMKIKTVQKDPNLFEITTCNIPSILVDLMDEIVSKGLYISRSELIRDAINNYIADCSKILLQDDIKFIDLNVFDNNKIVKLNLLNKEIRLEQLLGKPWRIYKGYIYEYRFNKTMKKPRWVSVGRTEDIKE